MILSCDPPRNAFLIHFGARQQPGRIETPISRVREARVELAVRADSDPPVLVAIHFPRGCFRLPFLGASDGSATAGFDIRSGYRQGRYYFHFGLVPRDCERWPIHPGLTVLASAPPEYAPGSRRIATDRPLLRGLEVDTDVLRVETDESEFVFEFGADNLKDVFVSLFIRRDEA